MKKNYHNYIQKQKNRLRERLDSQEESLKKLIESKLSYEEKYGKYPELIKIGEIDRIGGHSPQIIDNEEMKKSYEYGYYVKGSRTLAGEFEKGTYSVEEQRTFGINDLNNGVIDEYLLNLKDYPDYIKGRIYQKGRNIYDYIIENNIEIDKYIKIMSIVESDVTNSEFKKGYSEEKEERENSHKIKR